MSAFKTLVSLALLVSTRLAFVQASIYVTNPVQSSVCHGGQSCPVEWVDDGQSPLLSDIGECTVGLYNGEMLLAQSLTSVNVADSHSFSFTPNPSAGDNGGYYLVFTSTGSGYQGWSGTFNLDGMTGSSGSGSSTGGSTVAGSSTIGGGSSTGVSTLSAPSSVSSSTSTHSSSTTSATASATQSGAAIRAGASTSLAGGLVLALAGALVF
ncbi:hypothetical protein EDB19DRAFT_1735111 [Suillus lakei]|nr:hypothetical protein EDB19DRAFT_1735111 [Suillus lakei]